MNYKAMDQPKNSYFINIFLKIKLFFNTFILLTVQVKYLLNVNY